MTMQKPPTRTLRLSVPAAPAPSAAPGAKGSAGPASAFKPASGPSGPVRRAAAPAGTLTRVAGPTDTIRLNKRMAERGLCSRREADDWIAKGWVKVNGEVAPMGLQVKPTDRIEIDRLAEGQQATQVTILLNKPMGFVSGQAEDGHEPAVTLFTAQNRWRDDNARFFFHPSQLRGLAPAGRLDIDSIGLLVLTQDGRVARQLIGEDSVMEKEYLVRVSYLGTGEAAPRTPARAQVSRDADRFEASPAQARAGALRTIHENDPVTTDVQSVFPPALLARLRHGLSLDGQALKPAQVDWQNPEQLRFVLTEGKKRQIRRMCELVGLKVVGLKRVRIGRVMLGNLPVGQWRYLAPHERF